MINDHAFVLKTARGYFGDDCTIDMGFGPCMVTKGGRANVYFTETVIEEKTHEMTLDEIEKKLGYKVKIVNKKE